MFLEYETLDDANIVETEIRFFDDDDDKQIHLLKYNNGSFLTYQKLVFLNNNIFYNFEKDT